MNHADSEYLRGLRAETIATLTEAICLNQDVALIDAPNQINVGDSLIWAGEIAYFRTLRLNIRYTTDLTNYEPNSLRRAMPKGIVLIHGGGNFGDVWVGHQDHREQIARDLPDYKIIQLPQSIYFESRDRAAQANSILREHSDFHVLVRDMVSAQRAADELPDVRTSFCHDMALGWDAPQRSAPRMQTPRVLVIARQDRESSSGLASLAADSVPGAVLDITDWGDLGAHRPAWERARRDARLQYRLARAARRSAPFQSPRFQPWIQRTFAKINTLNVTAGVALYDSASGAIVDRLHAHIIAALCGVPHVLLDNNYGKVKAVYDASTHGFSTAHYVTTLDAACELASELMMSATT